MTETLLVCSAKCPVKGRTGVCLVHGCPRHGPVMQQEQSGVGDIASPSLSEFGADRTSMEINVRSVLGQSLSRGLMAIAFLFTMASAAGAVSVFPNVVENDPPDLVYGLLGSGFNSTNGDFTSTSVFPTMAMFDDPNGPDQSFLMATFSSTASGLGNSVTGSFSALDSSAAALLEGTLIAVVLDGQTVQYLATITGGLLAGDYGGIGSAAVLKFGGFGAPIAGVLNTAAFAGTVDIVGATVVPVPAALPLLLTAFGGLVFLARRRRSAHAV